LYSDLGLWDRALDDRRRAFEINEPALSAQWWSYATLLAQAGDRDGYRRLCRRMQERFQGYMGLIAADVVRTSCIMPDGETNYLREAALLGADPREIPAPLYLYVLSSGANRVNITNESAAPGVLVSGMSQQVGNIDGAGTTQVNPGDDLTANHIVQSALIIGGTSGSHGLVTIDASDASGNPLVESLNRDFTSAISLAPSGQFDAGIANDGTIAEFGVFQRGSGSTLSIPESGAGDSGAATLSTAVPEPSAAVLVTIAALACGSMTRRRRSRRTSYAAGR
jgi:hypothetical protein